MEDQQYKTSEEQPDPGSAQTTAQGEHGAHPKSKQAHAKPRDSQ